MLIKHHEVYIQNIGFTDNNAYELGFISKMLKRSYLKQLLRTSYVFIETQ
jgi:hypothetical protein